MLFRHTYLLSWRVTESQASVLSLFVRPFWSPGRPKSQRIGSLCWPRSSTSRASIAEVHNTRSRSVIMTIFSDICRVLCRDECSGPASCFGLRLTGSCDDVTISLNFLPPCLESTEKTPSEHLPRQCQDSARSYDDLG